MEFAKKVWAEVTKDDVFTWGSALAYAWIFAIFPFMIFLLTLAPYMPGNLKDKAMGAVENAAWSSVGGDAGQKIVDSVNEVMSKQKGGLLSFGGFGDVRVGGLAFGPVGEGGFEGGPVTG